MIRGSRVLRSVIMILMLPKRPRLRLAMSAESPITVSSTPTSTTSSAASSRAQSPAYPEWNTAPDTNPPWWRIYVDTWRGDTNPRPTSVEMRRFVQDAGYIFQRVLEVQEEQAQTVRNVRVLRLDSNRVLTSTS